MLLQETNKKKKHKKKRSSRSGRRYDLLCSFRWSKVRVGPLLSLTEQQELALIPVEAQQLGAEVLDVGVQAVLPQQDGKVLQL